MLVTILLTLMMMSPCSPLQEADTDMFSSVSEMSKLAQLELLGIEQLHQMRNLLEQRSEASISQLQSNLSQTFAKFPKQSELEGAANGLFLLQETFKLNVSMFSQGTVQLPAGRYSSSKILMKTLTSLCQVVLVSQQKEDSPRVMLLSSARLPSTESSMTEQWTGLRWLLV